MKHLLHVWVTLHWHHLLFMSHMSKWWNCDSRQCVLLHIFSKSSRRWIEEMGQTWSVKVWHQISSVDQRADTKCSFGCKTQESTETLLALWVQVKSDIVCTQIFTATLILIIYVRCHCMETVCCLSLLLLISNVNVIGTEDLWTRCWMWEKLNTFSLRRNRCDDDERWLCLVGVCRAPTDLQRWKLMINVRF